MIKKFIAAVIVATSMSGTAFAMTAAEKENERTMLTNAHLLDYRPSRPATDEAKGTVELEAEILHMANTNNRVGIQENPIDGVSLIPRFKVRVYPQNSYYLGVGANPPVPYDGYSYGFLAAEAGATLQLEEKVAMTGRVFVADSNVIGPVVEDEASDVFHAQQRGADVSVGIDIDTVSLSAGIGWGQLDAELEIDSSGVEQQIVDRNYKYSAGSVAWSPVSGYRLNYNQNFTEGGDLQHWSVSLVKQF